jgi:carboxyl-terminal processing protease
LTSATRRDSLETLLADKTIGHLLIRKAVCSVKFRYLVLLVFLFANLTACGGGGGGGGSTSGTSSDITLDLSGVYIPPDCQGKTITAYPTAADLVPPTPQPNPVLSLTDQMNLLDDVNNAVTDQYVYPNYNGANWSGLVASFQTEIQGGLDTETFYAKAQNLISALGDEHSYILSPAQVAADKIATAGQNSYVGFGVVVQPLPDKEKGTITDIFVDSPAEHGGLAPHDSILSVNGFPLVDSSGKSYPERLKGPECTGAELTVQTPGQAQRKLTMVRYHITGPLPVYERLVATTDGSRIGYIFIPTFLDSTIPDQVKNALSTLGQPDGLIIDNRMNGGGLGSVRDAFLAYFTAGHVGDFVNRTATQALDITADPVDNSQTVPLIVLVGTYTVSFGEISSGILQDVGRAKLVGKTTLGNVESLSGFDFFDGSTLWLAFQTFDPVNSHADWEATGIIPDINADADWDTFTFDNDPGVVAAVTALGHI